MHGAGLDVHRLAPATLPSHAPERQPLPWVAALMQDPWAAPTRVADWADALRTHAQQPVALLAALGSVGDAPALRDEDAALAALRRRLLRQSDPLAASLRWLQPLARTGWTPTLPDRQALPAPLRDELALMLAAMGQAHALLGQALARVPQGLDTANALQDLIAPEAQRTPEPHAPADVGVQAVAQAALMRDALLALDRPALLAGLRRLSTAAQALIRAVQASRGALPAVDWTLATPLGEVVIDTTGRSQTRTLSSPLLLLDVGGDDHYRFHAAPAPVDAAGRPLGALHVLLDVGGNDRYEALDDGADPSAAVRGLGLLWDTAGDDRYQGTRCVQACAVLGGAVLVDDTGDNQFDADALAQAWAMGGFALLRASPGADQYHALTHAQASAGPMGVAVLLDPAGDDRYTLAAKPLRYPSAQSASANTSMGQGAGRGERGTERDGPMLSGGVGALLDMAGNDQYHAQVFAQGVGYQQGLGLLVDDAGDDQFDAIWYAQGAAAHEAMGLLLKRGSGHDHYQTSHTLAQGAAHDRSVGILVDEAGDDTYALRDLGLGLGHDNSTGLILDLAGNDHYQVRDPACRALGAALVQRWSNRRERLPGAGVFLDLGGHDTYPPSCAGRANGAQWRHPARWPTLDLPSERAQAWDGQAAPPWPLRALTPADAP
ncbi:MAG: hypothetical protein Fur007_10690 [Rhodoferax sp.]